MQAPPLDLVPDMSTPSSNGTTTNSKPDSGSAPPQKSSDSGLTLPPLKDADVAPPKDLDLPPTDDLGNMNIDTKK
jgi:hypothetical protein